VPQLENYLRATDLELGLLLHFGTPPASIASFPRTAIGIDQRLFRQIRHTRGSLRVETFRIE
jgi:hypothetical protein